MAGHAPVTRAAPGRGRAAGFTLVEILVVLAILATLIALVAAMVPQALKQKEITRAQSLVNGVGATLELLKNDPDALGKYPPSQLKDLRIGKQAVGKDIVAGNDLNAGSEVVYYCLNTELIRIERPPTNDASLVGNTDTDQYRAVRGTADSEAREYIDPWGRPLVYFHCNDYKDPKGRTDYISAEGEKISVRPRKLPAKLGGGYLNPNGFQLFSLGPDGVQDDPDADEEDGEDGDDIVYGVP